MKKTFYPIFYFAILFLFFIQMAGMLVSSIYTLDLLNTSLDAKVLGLLFFFSPVLLFAVRKNAPNWLKWTLFVILFLGRGLSPSLDTNGKTLISGVATAACLLLLPMLFSAQTKNEKIQVSGVYAALGLAMAVGISIMLRTMNSSIDYSLTSAGSWMGWGLGLLLGYALAGLEPARKSLEESKNTKGITSAILGIFMVLTLIYFVLSAPAVFARWVEGNYAAIIMIASLISLGWFAMILFKPDLLKWLTEKILVGWNLLFSVFLVGITLVYRVSFPADPKSIAFVAGNPTFWQQLPLYLLLLLFPVVFFDLKVFWDRLQLAETTPNRMAGGMLLGSFSLVILVFMNIFTNVWGYVEPVSPFFRNKFWLPFFLICFLLCVLIFIHRKPTSFIDSRFEKPKFRLWGLILLAILVVTANGLFVPLVKVDTDIPITSLKVMTYNIQQANDSSGEQSYLRQLAIIQQVRPDILALQESDSTRISLNNVDFVRYYADKLGYHTYYGPTTITGSYGTAILSRFPIMGAQTIFTYSDQDENGTAIIQIEVDGKTFNIYNVHPDGSDEAKLAIVHMLLEQSEYQTNVIILGDFNMRETEESYQLVDSKFTNAWMSVYPSGISPDGVDMSGRNRIDHIFISNNLMVRNPVYVLPPDSATDHPVHWAEVYWRD